VKYLLLLVLTLVATVARASHAAESPPPNVIVILTDDQGYNDVGCFGSKLIKTPRLDRMASEGTRFTDWYAPAPVCTPTRAGLMTGCYPQRLGLSWILDEKPDGSPGHVLYGKSRHGLNLNEITIAELLKARGYATGMIGKWHLGDAPQFLPTKQGFDSYFGVPYSNDMKPPVLMRDEKVVEQPYPQEALIERYTEEATKFIREHANGDKPFFLYFAHNAPHTPLSLLRSSKASQRAASMAT
jgi:arylsulfatase A-like enzyme